MIFPSFQNTCATKIKIDTIQTFKTSSDQWIHSTSIAANAMMLKRVHFFSDCLFCLLKSELVLSERNFSFFKRKSEKSKNCDMPWHHFDRALRFSRAKIFEKNSWIIKACQKLITHQQRANCVANCHYPSHPDLHQVSSFESLLIIHLFFSSKPKGFRKLKVSVLYFFIPLLLHSYRNKKNGKLGRRSTQQ